MGTQFRKRSNRISFPVSLNAAQKAVASYFCADITIPTLHNAFEYKSFPVVYISF